jgi:uncharacterized membrane protein YphA (DoxX/SURF4 family)
MNSIIAFVWSAIFIWAGLEKVMQPAAFAESIQAYKLIPEYFAPWLARFLPWLEIWAALALLWPRTRATGALLVGTLSVVFALAVTSVMLRGLEINCGCFGPFSGKVGWKTLALDLAGIISMSWLLREAFTPTCELPAQERHL